MVMGLIGAGLGIAAPIAANALGIGKNDTRARTFDESKAYDPHAFQYGGRDNGADYRAKAFEAQGGMAQNRAAPQAGLVGTDYSSANRYNQMAVNDRASQGRVANMMMQRAQGLVPSIASQQATLDMQRAAASQASAGASARGAAGLALAGQNAANNTATMQGQISNNAQINGANERMQAEQGAFGAFSGIRAGDAQAQQMQAQQAQYQAQLHAQQNQYNAGLQAQSRGQNDAYSMGLYGQENNVRQMQMNGAIAGQGLLGNSQTNATNQNIAISQNNANREYQYYQQAMGALGGGLQGAGQMGGAGTPMPQPATGVGAPTSGISTGSGGGVAGTNMVGIPQAGTGSDDRMKMGMSPLGLLGFGGGGGMNPTSGPAASSYEVLSGGGENVAASGQAMSNVATQYQQDPTSYGDGPGAHSGMMSGGGLLSDDRAKQQAFDLGVQQGRQSFVNDSLHNIDQNHEREALARDDASKEWLRDISHAPAVGSPLGGAMVLGPMIYNALADKQEAESLRSGDRGGIGGERTPSGLADMASGEGRAFGGGASSPYVPRSRWVRERNQVASAPARPLDRDGPAYASERDPVTAQFAEGLAPIRFQYKPGMGPGGEQTGVRAQAAASQPVTSSMVTQRPDGLLQLDPHMGLGTALAGVGHLAKKQQATEARLDGLLAASARREGY